MQSRSILEEILYVHQQACECGVGLVLLDREDGPSHRLKTQCRRCGMVRVFQLRPAPGFLADFDPYAPVINPEQTPSQLIDAVGWFILATQLTESSTRPIGSRRARRLAVCCLKELLKFYRPGQSFPSSEISDPSKLRFYLKKRYEFRRDRVLGILRRLDNAPLGDEGCLDGPEIEILPAVHPCQVKLSGQLGRASSLCFRWLIETLEKLAIDQVDLDTEQLLEASEGGLRSYSELRERLYSSNILTEGSDDLADRLFAIWVEEACLNRDEKKSDASIPLILALAFAAFLLGGALAWIL